MSESNIDISNSEHPKPVSKMHVESTPFLNLTQVDWATIGVYPDAPIGLANQLAALGPVFFQNHLIDDPEYTKGNRTKFSASLNLPAGQLEIFVKEKSFMGQTAKELHEEYVEASDYYNEVLEKQQSEGYIDKRELNIALIDVHKTKPIRSVLRELRMNSLASVGYKQVFNEDLPVEHALGIVVSREGRKWVIYDKLDELNLQQLTPSQRADIARRKVSFDLLMESRLKQIGIKPVDYNSLIIGYPSNLSAVKFVIVDTERWEEVKAGDK